jgi:hypothetical protein
MAGKNSTATKLNRDLKRSHEAIVLVDKRWAPDPDGLGHGVAKSIGFFASPSEARAAARKALPATAGAVGYAIRLAHASRALARA